MSDVFVHSETLMDTVVTIEIVGHHSASAVREGVRGGLAWFLEVTECCSRFDPASELSRLCARPGEPVAVSDLLFESIQFALAVAVATNGAFDPTVGAAMQQRGFDREYRTGASVRTPVTRAVTFRDVLLEEAHRTVMLAAPMMLDLGAVAKGLAIDLAVRELAPFQNFAIDAGGDLSVRGLNRHGEPWLIGIRHPRDPGATIASLRASDAAVCTSGDYERLSGSGAHHLLDPRSNDTASRAVSATVQAPSAMVADAFSTAAFVLGAQDGVAFLESQSVNGFVVTPALEKIATAGMQFV